MESLACIYWRNHSWCHRRFSLLHLLYLCFTRTWPACWSQRPASFWSVHWETVSRTCPFTCTRTTPPEPAWPPCWPVPRQELTWWMWLWVSFLVCSTHMVHDHLRSTNSFGDVITYVLEDLAHPQVYQTSWANHQFSPRLQELSGKQSGNRFWRHEYFLTVFTNACCQHARCH